MNRDEIYLFVFASMSGIVLLLSIYGLYRWYVHKNRIESIYEQKDLSKSNGSHSNQNQSKET